MRTFVSAVSASYAFASITSAQSSISGLSLAPAATTVTASSSSAPPLFPLEAVQLTDAVLDNVASNVKNESISSLFSFGSSSDVSKRAARECKLLPGDELWPAALIWDIFDLLLGNRLIKATPLAASCYPAWPEYDAEKCATITSEWLTSNLQ
jgi:hypothetical protein